MDISFLPRRREADGARARAMSGQCRVACGSGVGFVVPSSAGFFEVSPIDAAEAAFIVIGPVRTTRHRRTRAQSCLKDAACRLHK